MKMEKVRGEITGFYLRFCESYPFGVRKLTFWRAKAYLLGWSKDKLLKAKMGIKEQY
jgi:hypothetical protein